MSSDAAKLVHAAGVGNDAKVKRLLKAKVDVNLESDGALPLHLACVYGHVGAARLLLKAKATLDLRDSQRSTRARRRREGEAAACGRERHRPYHVAHRSGAARC